MALEAATASDWWCTQRRLNSGCCRRISDCSQPLHRVSQKMHRVSHSWPANQLIQSGSSSKFKPTIKTLESLTFDNNRPSSDQKSEVLPFCWKRGFFGFHFFYCRSLCNAYCCKTNCCCFTTATHLWGGALSSDSLTFKRRGQRTAGIDKCFFAVSFYSSPSSTEKWIISTKTLNLEKLRT